MKRMTRLTHKQYEAITNNLDEHKRVCIRDVAIENHFKRINGVTFIRCHFSSIELHELHACIFVDCVFDDCKLFYIRQSQFHRCTFGNSELMVSLCLTTFKECIFQAFISGALSCCRFEHNTYPRLTLSPFTIANLDAITLQSLAADVPQHCPRTGDVTGYKKVRVGDSYAIVTLLVPDGVRRSSALGTICRAAAVRVQKIETLDGSPLPEHCLPVSIVDPMFIYKADTTLYPSGFDSNRFRECALGIHFFLTKKEAIDYAF